MRVYDALCHCSAESPTFPTSEQVDRWFVDHYQIEHPDKLDDLIDRLVHGTIRRELNGVVVNPT